MDVIKEKSVSEGLEGFLSVGYLSKPLAVSEKPVVG